MANPWIKSVAEWDNAPALASAQVPVLTLFASLDTQMPSAIAVARARQALAVGGTGNRTVQTLEGLNHYMQSAQTGGVEEYADPDRTPFGQESLEAILSWLETNFPSN